MMYQHGEHERGGGAGWHTQCDVQVEEEHLHVVQCLLRWRGRGRAEGRRGGVADWMQSDIVILAVQPTVGSQKGNGKEENGLNVNILELVSQNTLECS